MSISLPDGVLAFASRGGTWASYVDGLPRLVADLLSDWDLAVSGKPTHGRCSLVVPVLASDGTAAMLKVGWPHDEAEHEALALQTWQGVGAVRLLRADPQSLGASS